MRIPSRIDSPDGAIFTERRATSMSSHTSRLDRNGKRVPWGQFSLAQAFTPVETKPKYELLFPSAPFRGRRRLILNRIATTDETTPPEGSFEEKKTSAMGSCSTGVNAWARERAQNGRPRSVNAGAVGPDNRCVPANSPRRCPGLNETGAFGPNFRRALALLAVCLMVLASTSRGLAQIGGTSKATDTSPNRSSTSGAAADEIPATLDETLARAMETNPDIVTATAKLRLAEAELNNTRAEVAGKAITLWGERQTLKELLQVARGRFERVEKLHKNGTIGGEDGTFERARTDLIEAEAKRSRSDTELRYLIGRSVPAALRGVTEHRPMVADRLVALAGGRLSDALASTRLLNLIGQSASTASQSGDSRTGATMLSELLLSEMLHAPKGPMVEKLRKMLSRPTDMAFNEHPLSDMVDYLKDFHGIEIQIDKEALSEAGIALDFPMTINVNRMPFSAVIQLLDDKFPQMKLVVRDYGILVTTPQRAQEQGYFPAVELARLGDGGEAAAGKPAEPAQPKESPKRSKSPPLTPVLTPPKK
jgi:hypothetical protein